MKVRATVSGFEPMLRQLRRRGRTAAQAASAAAAEALVQTLDRAKDTQGISAPLLQTQRGNRYSVGIADTEAIGRELGTLHNEANPWLAPVLPAARGPMRAAAASAATRAISSRKGNA